MERRRRGASGAIRVLAEHWDATQIAEFDPEPFTDFATVRPFVVIDEGHRQIVWPTVDVWAASLPSTDVLLVIGPEPALRWRRFCEQVVSLAEHYDVSMAIGLGALLAEYPTAGRRTSRRRRPTSRCVTASASAPRATRARPASSACSATPSAAGGMPTASLWAAVPTYTAQLTAAKATAALVRAVCTMIRAAVPVDRPGRGGRRLRVAGRRPARGRQAGGLRRPSRGGDAADDADDDAAPSWSASSRSTPTPASSPRSSSSSANPATPSRFVGQTSAARAVLSLDTAVAHTELSRARSGIAPRRRTVWKRSPRIAANAFGPHHCAPTVPAGRASSANQPTSAVSSGWRGKLAAGRRAVEQQHVHREAGEPHPLAVDHGEQLLRLALDAGLLGDLLDGHLGRRVADVGPAGRVQPDPRVGALHEEDLAVVVADDGADRHLRRDVAGHADADRLHPLLDEVGVLATFLGRQQHLVGGHLDVGGDPQHLLEALPLVQVLGEPEPGAGDRRQRLAPAHEVAVDECSPPSTSSVTAFTLLLAPAAFVGRCA